MPPAPLTDIVPIAPWPGLVEAARPYFDLFPGEHFWIAGGFLRDHLTGHKPKDADLWFADQEGADRSVFALKDMRAKKTGGVKSSEVKGEWASDTYEEVPGVDLPVNIIWDRERDTPAHVIASFDLTCCAAALDRNGCLWAHRQFLADARGPFLRALHAKTGVGELRRALRFARDRGFAFETEDDHADAIREWARALAAKDKSKLEKARADVVDSGWLL